MKRSFEAKAAIELADRRCLRDQPSSIRFCLVIVNSCLRRGSFVV